MRIKTVFPIVVLVTAFTLRSLAQQPPAAPLPAVPLKDIFFDTGEFTLREDAKPVLTENAEILVRNPDINVEIVGYCNREEYAPDYNLGRKRAEATKKFLAGLGVEPQRISLSTECNGDYDGDYIASELLEVEMRLDSRVHLKATLHYEQGFL